jgi:hypothetical protein
MTAALDRARLAAVLGMCGSAHDGEALAAGRMADRLVRAAGSTWVQVLAAEPAGPQRCDCHVCVCERLLSRARALTDWEITFCASVMRRERAPSAKQNAVLAKLSRRLGFDSS